MPFPEPEAPGPDPAWRQPEPIERQPETRLPQRNDASANTDLIRLVAAAADLCRKPLRHGVVPISEPVGDGEGQPLEVCLRLEVRSSEGERRPEQDLELEIYPSGSDLNLTLAWCQDEQRPMLWQGSHPVWMDAGGTRCAPPADGAPLEALARRLRALLVHG
jgi:hypothetical protein